MAGASCVDRGNICVDWRNESKASWQSRLLLPRPSRPPGVATCLPADAKRMAVSLRRRSITRLVYITTAILLAWFFLGPSSNQSRQVKSEEDYKIREHNFIERATRPDKSLNVQRHPFLQARMGRDERDDVFNDLIFNGAQDYWERFQLP